MLSVFRLADALHENISKTNTQDVATPCFSAYHYNGTLEEAFLEFHELVLQECLSVRETEVTINEIMTEAAIVNPDSLEVLTEASIKEFGTNIIELLKKFGGWIKGLVEKIAETIKRVFDKSQNWIKANEPRVQEAVRAGVDPEVTMHQFDQKYLKVDGNAIISGVDHLREHFFKNINVALDGCDSLNEKDFDGNIAAGATAAGAANAVGMTDTAKRLIDGVTRKSEEFEDKLKNELKIAFTDYQFGGAKDQGPDFDADPIKSIKASLIAKALGKEETAALSTFQVNVSDMLDYIRNYSKTYESLNNSLKSTLKEIEEVSRKGEQLANKREDSLIRGKHLAGYREYYAAVSKVIQQNMKAMSGVIGQCQSANEQICRTALDEYTTALSNMIRAMKNNGKAKPTTNAGNAQQQRPAPANA